jgi:hypothetical protein
MLPADTFQDRNHDGFADYLNVRIYVADRATPEEIAAAANIAARLTFEVLSIDLPIGFPMSAYNNSETSVAIIIGSAADRFSGNDNQSLIVTTDGSRRILAIPRTDIAESFARTLGTELEIEEDPELSHPSPDKSFSISNLFTSEGLLGDRDGDRIPERIDTTIVLGADVHAVEVIDLAARIALEAAGGRIPLVITDQQHDVPPNPVLIGSSNRYLRTSGQLNSFKPELRAGHGRIEVIDLENGTGSILIIAGADDAGEAAAITHAARRLPFVWDHGKERLHLSHVENDLRRFFSRRSDSGQAAAALRKARQCSEILEQEDLATASMEVLVDGNCGPCLDYIAGQFPDLHVTAENLNVMSGSLIFEETHHLTWEVEDARRRILECVIPAIRPGSRVEIEVRVSESPETRATLAQEIRELVLARETDPNMLTIHVIAAHKQAYCWIDEILKPRLKHAAQIRIKYREIVSETSGTIESSHRWLHELYPIDEVLSRDLGIPIDRISFDKSNSDEVPTYEVSAEDSSGQPILHESFEPRFVIRTMFDSIPDYARVRVSTGWLHAAVDRTVVADEQIETDPERFWNCYQSSALPRIREYILRLYDGKPGAECAPHFGTLEVDLWLSEPDYRIGIGEERISTLEALHEDIYFETLLFLEILGMNYPGRIIPRVHRARDGQNGLARIRFTGKAGPNPRVDLKWRDRTGTSFRHTENLLPTRNGTPQTKAVTVRSGHSSVVSLEITGIPDTKENFALFEAIREFHEHGVGLSWLSYENIDVLKLGSIEIPRTKACHGKPRIEPPPNSDLNDGNPIVQWDTPIGPNECEHLIRKLSAFPEVHAFHAGTSYLGLPIWALDVTAPLKGKYISQARASVAKPVLFVTGRQHANEVSSTSHILKLAELLATDPEIRKLLERVHFILHPMTNPDGAALVDELCRDTPDFILHAGYLGALGVDVTGEQWSENPRYPEAHVRRYLWEMWLPDIVLNPHGYPSHEWVQLFAGYTAWVKSRSVTARDWWIPRGWFIPGFVYMEGTSETAFHIRDRVTADMRSLLGTWNTQMYRRYAKYGATEIANFKMQFCNDLLVYSLEKGLIPKPDGFTFMQRYPQITLLETVTEVPDEVAHGDWLKTLAEAGLEFSLAHARYLAENHNTPKRTIRHTALATVLKFHRTRYGPPAL